MPFSYPVPVDDTYDYIPILDPTTIVVGTRLFSVLEMTGVITSIIPGDSSTLWAYSVDVQHPDGTLVPDAAFLPDDPAGQDAAWWLRHRIVRRVDKPAPRELLEAPDHSAWIYPATDGRVTCYRTAGTAPVYARGDTVFRGQWTVDPHDLYTSEDPDWDWLPVNDPADLVVGDTIMFSRTFLVDVDEVLVDDTNPAFTRTEFRNTGVPIGWVDALQEGAVAAGYVWSFMERIPNPDSDSLFAAPDGSQWIYTGASEFYCWSAGARYALAAVFHRGEIAGGLTPL